MRVVHFLGLITFVLLLPREGSGQVLYQNDFNQLQLGQLGAGEWRVADGVLRSDGPQQGTSWVALGDQSWQTYQVDLDFQFQPWGNLIFGWRVDPNAYNAAYQLTEGILGYSVAIHPNFAPPNFSVMVSEAQCLEHPAGNWQLNPPYVPGWHHLTALVDPTSLIVSIDGTFVAGFQDAQCSLSPGYFALGNQAGTIEVDNLIVQDANPVSTRSDATWGRIKATWR